MTKYNILDYSPIDEGITPADALKQTTELAKLAEKLGYYRFWVAEHHNVLSVAGSSPEMLMMHLAANTETIKIGSGGVMLPHYSAYKVAENFRMLSALNPERIDLGIGRSPSYKAVFRALNKEKDKKQLYEDKIKELIDYFNDQDVENFKFGSLIATPVVPGPEMWMLSSSKNGAEIAADNGLNYSFAHFGNPDKGRESIEHYLNSFNENHVNKNPKIMVATLAVIATTNEEAERLAQTLHLWMLFVEGTEQPMYLPSVETAVSRGFTGREKEKIEKQKKRMVIGDVKSVAKQLKSLADTYKADEVTVIPNFYGSDNRIEGIKKLSEELNLT